MNRQETIISFLSDLAGNNNREWFQANRARYDEFKAITSEFALEFLSKMSRVDAALAGLDLKDITYRIYRDIRFSQDKSPYKTWFGAYLCPGGKKSCHAGYYIHFEPNTQSYMLCAGLYNPTPQSLKSIREEIDVDGDKFHSLLQSAAGFEPEWSTALSRVPLGYDKNHPYADYLRLRSYSIASLKDVRYFTAANLIDMAVKELSSTVQFNALLNQCVDFREY